jgi:hypothetical protein
MTRGFHWQDRDGSPHGLKEVEGYCGKGDMKSKAFLFGEI